MRWYYAVEEFLTTLEILMLSFAVGLSAIWLLCRATGYGELHSTWPESAEFSTLDTGQERFSEHATNIDGVTVLVDHETGAQYVRDDDGMTALLDADGTPLLVAEAGS